MLVFGLNVFPTNNYCLSAHSCEVLPSFALLVFMAVNFPDVARFVS